MLWLNDSHSLSPSWIHPSCWTNIHYTMVGPIHGWAGGGKGGSKGCWNYSWNRQLQDWQYWTWNKLRLNFVGQIIGIGLHAFKSIFRFKNYFFTEIFKWRFQTYQLCLFLSVNRNWEMESETKLSLTFALLAKKKLCSCSSLRLWLAWSWWCWLWLSW